MVCFGIGVIAGGYIGGRLTDNLGFYWVQVFSLLLNGVLFIVLSYTQGLWQIAGCIFLLASFGEAFRPTECCCYCLF